ncbi:MAG: molybdopterin converting factor [Acidithiobacillales bacterium SG8_45]|jgi:molybdopterin synthase sulfur carrier subunit|nr:MAG: molybdopterin converting factor [Acidithiobacillales bacterium SG8_45]
MSISVKYFASIRERLNRSEEILDTDGIGTAADVWIRATGEDLPANLLVAINQEHARVSDPVRDGDEVAFFPPVTGG